jgi:hypothetical protein
MPMIDVGIKIEIDETGSTTAADPTTPVTKWLQLKDCTALPALMQPSSKIATDFVGDKFTGEIAGKKGVTGLDFTFAYDGGDTTNQYKKMYDMDAADSKHWLRVTYPDGTKFELLVKVETSLVAVAPSAEIDYTVSFTAVRSSLQAFGGDLIHVVFKSDTDPLVASTGS